MKKFISVLCSLFLIFTLTGCSQNDVSNVTGSYNEPITPSATESSESSPSSSEPKEEPKGEPQSFNIKLSFAGDVMIASFKNQTTSGSFNEYAEKNTPDYFFKEVQSVFANDDFTTVNLENVLTDKKLTEAKKDHNPAFWFYSKTANTKILTEGSIEGVSIANNHTYDYGSQGYKDTNAAVKKAGLNYGNYEKIMYYEKNGFRIAVICYGLWRTNGVPTIKNLIAKAEKESDYQIVYFHGGKERIYAPEEWKVTACHDLVDAGADLVIGNHPHVLQPREIYNGVEIIYSLGNFCFGGNKQPGKNTIIYQMELTVNSETLALEGEKSEIIPCYVYPGKWNNYQPCLITDETEKARVLDFMNGKSDSPY